ncbi:hypothetical protein PAXRUDRAFT_829742 [Paxillus rubicundulus Ve08.2h10]|uniref:Uncharacterized protein n=1 Tax=Paxillus rubicundulus Ve08.2h10 TaxID=930991 RepID=A0A0D0DUF1_9AGAM|nr:hypothetical protein PAXRUDRAFT_829742 [Paxillus rubicundulus Ve08.2h10]
MSIVRGPGIGRRIMDPRVLSDEVGSSDDTQSQTVNSDLPIAPTSRAASRNSPYAAFREPSPSGVHSRPLHTHPETSMPSPAAAPSTVPVRTPNSPPSSLITTSSWHPDNLYSGLATYIFGEAPTSPPVPSISPHDAVPEAVESVSPLTPLVRCLSPDRTPRPSVFGQPAFPPLENVSSHPSQGAGHPASTPSATSTRRQSTTRETLRRSTTSSSSSTSRTASRTDGEESEDPISDAYYNSPFQRGRVIHDNASQHTFGRGSRHHGVIAATSSQDAAAAVASSSSVSVVSSRSSSRASMRTFEQFSSDEEVEICYYDGASSPVTFARDYLADINEDVDLADPSPAFYRTSMFEGRRGSLPMAIPGAVPGGNSSSVRSREGSIIALRRPSRSWDEASMQLSSHSGEDPKVIVPKSEPLSRADWSSLGAQVQAQHQLATEAGGTYDGLDLRYILSKHSEGSIRSFRSSAQLSFAQGPSGTHQPSDVSSRLSSIAPFASGVRRTSSATLQTTYSNDDTFFKHVRKWDETFDVIENHWSFMREKADIPLVISDSASSSRQARSSTSHPHVPNADKTTKTMFPGTQEIWRCGHVGRFKVDRLAFKPQSADPAKAAQHRINIRHFPDPYLKGNTTTGPHSVIHKHSRAIAFSIFRSHGLFSGRRSGVGGGSKSQNVHMNTRYGIMLAPKKVQEQYTSTKSTRQLSTHGLLDDDSRRSKSQVKLRRNATQSLSFGERDSRDKERRRAREREREEQAKAKAKAKAASKGKGKKDKRHEDRLTWAESTESSTATSSGGSIITNAAQQIISTPTRSATKIQFSSSTTGSALASRPDSPTESLPPPSVSDSVKFSASDTSSIPTIRSHRDHRDSMDSDHRLPARTPHAEAFGALDPNDIEHYRLKAHNRVITDPGSSLAGRILRAFRGSSRPDGPPSSTASQPNAYQPPWMTTAGRDQQEENDRVLNDLNASFRDVGLLHTQPHKSASKSALRRKPHQEIFDQIPDDCLYMLLPLWAGETDTSDVQAQGSDSASLITVLEHRKYLLVYYVPFDDAPSGKKSEQQKKKAKQSHSSDSGGEGDPKSVFLPVFRVIARVVTYDELRLTGVRVPSDGLAITGPAWEAMSYTSSPPPRISLNDTVVCVCHDRDQGFVFLSDALYQLGLCTAEELPIDPNLGTEDGPKESEKFLTTIGRAIVEMIWLGCLAITSFGPV